jgi:methylisocitrate lyase
LSAAALAVYETIVRDGSQRAAIPSMQTRDELYRFLDYHAYEEKLDALFAAGKH